MKIKVMKKMIAVMCAATVATSNIAGSVGAFDEQEIEKQREAAKAVAIAYSDENSGEEIEDASAEDITSAIELQEYYDAKNSKKNDDALKETSQNQNQDNQVECIVKFNAGEGAVFFINGSTYTGLDCKCKKGGPLEEEDILHLNCNFYKQGHHLIGFKDMYNDKEYLLQELDDMTFDKNYIFEAMWEEDNTSQDAAAPQNQSQNPSQNQSQNPSQNQIQIQNQDNQNKVAVEIKPGYGKTIPSFKAKVKRMNTLNKINLDMWLKGVKRSRWRLVGFKDTNSNKEYSLNQLKNMKFKESFTFEAMWEKYIFTSEFKPGDNAKYFNEKGEECLNLSLDFGLKDVRPDYKLKKETLDGMQKEFKKDGYHLTGFKDVKSQKIYSLTELENMEFKEDYEFEAVWELNEQNQSQNPLQNSSQNQSQNPLQNSLQNQSQNPLQNPFHKPSPSQNPLQSQNPSQSQSQNPNQDNQVQFVVAFNAGDDAQFIDQDGKKYSGENLSFSASGFLTEHSLNIIKNNFRHKNNYRLVGFKNTDTGEEITLDGLVNQLFYKNVTFEAMWEQN